VKRGWFEWDHDRLKIGRQCELLGLPRSTLYYRGVRESEENLRLMQLLEQYLRTSFLESRRMMLWLVSEGQKVNHMRTWRLMRTMQLETLWSEPKPKLSQSSARHKICRYLLRHLDVVRLE
jgi:putative transposase